LAGALRGAKKRIRVLSTPAAGWLWEIGMTDMFPAARFDFVGIERDARVHDATRRNAAKIRKRSQSSFVCCAKPLDSAFYTKSVWPALGEDPYDMVYLDWMGSWTRDKLDELRSVCTSGILRRGGYLRFTVGLTRGAGRRVTVNQRGFYGWSGSVVDIRHGAQLRPIPLAYEIPQVAEMVVAEAGAHVRMVSGVVYSSTLDPINGRNAPEASYLMRLR
jgi:hypothetical protein